MCFYPRINRTCCDRGPLNLTAYTDRYLPRSWRPPILALCPSATRATANRWLPCAAAAAASSRPFPGTFSAYPIKCADCEAAFLDSLAVDIPFTQIAACLAEAESDRKLLDLTDEQRHAILRDAAGYFDLAFARALDTHFHDTIRRRVVRWMELLDVAHAGAAGVRRDRDGVGAAGGGVWVRGGQGVLAGEEGGGDGGGEGGGQVAGESEAGGAFGGVLSGEGRSGAGGGGA
ncbi:hypothetical protein VTK56DRAFT_2615 [Thermocarpiscus australiensis]